MWTMEVGHAVGGFGKILKVHLALRRINVEVVRTAVRDLTAVPFI